MQTPFFHPSVVHIPMALGVLMPLIAGGIALAWWRAWLPRRAWLVVVALQVLLVGSGVVALQTGEAEEERVERVVAESAIEAHEEAAEVFVWASGGVLVAMLVAAGFGQRRAAPVVAGMATLGTLVVLVLGYRTGQAGGSLVYEQGAASAYVDTSRGGPAGATPRSRDDDD